MRSTCVHNILVAILTHYFQIVNLFVIIPNLYWDETLILFDNTTRLLEKIALLLLQSLYYLRRNCRIFERLFENCIFAHIEYYLLRMTNGQTKENLQEEVLAQCFYNLSNARCHPIYLHR